MKKFKMRNCFFSALIFLAPVIAFAQEPAKEKDDLGDKEYIIVKDYKPVLAESYKISDTPDGDTTSVNPPEMVYSIHSQKAETDYEASTIKAVKIKDEQLVKLYRSYIRLGLGNYSIYNGDLFVNALRSKNGALGLALNHLSGSPGLKNAGSAGYSRNHGGVYGKYMLDHSVFSGELAYDRDAVHYYGFSTADTIIKESELRQRFNKLGVDLNFASNYPDKDHVDYSAGIELKNLSDKYDVTENDVIVKGFAGKDLSSFYFRTDVSFDYFKKTRASYELLTQESEAARHIINITPSILLKSDAVKLLLGVDFAMEKSLNTNVHLFPKAELTLPIAENILYAFANVGGGVVKNSYRTMTEENPFVNSAVLPQNTVDKVMFRAGLNGNFSSRLSFTAWVKYTSVDDLLLYYNDSVYFNKFDADYADGSILNPHLELTYKASDKFITSLKVDEYSYSLDFSRRAWHRPGTEVKLGAKYNLRDKLLLNIEIFGRGKYYVREQEAGGYADKSVNGFVDANLGVEYRYSKILSVFVNLNNLGFNRYYYWNNYPVERLNVLGGITYSF